MESRAFLRPTIALTHEVVRHLSQVSTRVVKTVAAPTWDGDAFERVRDRLVRALRNVDKARADSHSSRWRRELCDEGRPPVGDVRDAVGAITIEDVRAHASRALHPKTQLRTVTSCMRVLVVQPPNSVFTLAHWIAGVCGVTNEAHSVVGGFMPSNCSRRRLDMS